MYEVVRQVFGRSLEAGFRRKRGSYNNLLRRHLEVRNTPFFARAQSFTLDSILAHVSIMKIEGGGRVSKKEAWGAGRKAQGRCLVAPYRAILRYYRCDTPYRAILFKGV